MSCILVPRVRIGDPGLPKRGLRSRLSSSVLRKPAPAVSQNAKDHSHRKFGSIISANYGSVKGSFRRAVSAKVNRRESSAIAPNDIFPQTPRSLQRHTSTPALISLLGEDGAPNMSPAFDRSATPISVLTLEKPLPTLPDDGIGGERSAWADDFLQNLDVLAYSHDGVPSEHPEPEGTEAAQRPPTGGSSPAQNDMLAAPKEDDLVSARSESQMSSTLTVSGASSVDARRPRRPLSGALTHCTSVSGRTVTPMSSLESERELGAAKGAVPGPDAASRTEQGSESGTALSASASRRRNVPAPQACFHCGRDPTGKDWNRVAGSGTTSRELARSRSQDESGPGDEMASTTVAQLDRAEQRTQDREILHFRLLGEIEDTRKNRKALPTSALALDVSSPPGRPSRSNSHRTICSSSGESPQQRKRVDANPEDEHDALGHFQNTHPSTTIDQGRSFREWLSSTAQSGLRSPPPHMYEDDESQPELPDTEDTPRTSFWKDSNGTILVYQGIDMGAEQLYYGSDINYLGAFYDDDEGSSGLGSVRHSLDELEPTELEDGLEMILEGGSWSSDGA